MLLAAVFDKAAVLSALDIIIEVLRQAGDSVTGVQIARTGLTSVPVGLALAGGFDWHQNKGGSVEVL